MIQTVVAAGLNSFDLAIFITYLLVTVVLGFWVARRGRSNPRSYFLGGNKLPWYVIGTSMVAADVSGEHFISNVGAAYKYGIVVASGSWNTWIIYSLLIIVFLPYYVRSGIYTMPQFLEKRYNETCRYVFAVSLLVGYVAAMFAAALYSGGLALENMLGIHPVWGIVFFAIITGGYTIYGGLTSAAWTDFMQMWVLLLGGVLVPILGLWTIGGLDTLVAEHPEKFKVFLPTTHERFPFTGVFTGFLTVGIWYSCTSQHMVQRVLGAKDEWHARMGVILAGFLHIITPFFFALPGIIAVKMLPNLGAATNTRPDQAYLMLVHLLIPTGIRGLILAAIAAALMSHLSTVLNSASTLVTMDLYRKWCPDASERRQVIVGQLSGTVLLLIGVCFALYYYWQKDQPLFVMIQDKFFWLAPPFAVIFTMGLLWKRANATAALTTIISGFIFTGLVQWWFNHNKWVTQYFSNTYQHRALLAWMFCMLVMVVVSLCTAPPPAEKTDGIIWTRKYAGLPAEEAARYKGIRDYRIWWALFVGIIWLLYGFLGWLQVRHH